MGSDSLSSLSALVLFQSSCPTEGVQAVSPVRQILARGKIRRFKATYQEMPRPDGANIATKRHKSDFDHNRRLGRV